MGRFSRISILSGSSSGGGSEEEVVTIKEIQVTPTVTGGAYAVDESMGGEMTFSDVVASAGSAELMEVVVTSKDADTFSADLFLFDTAFSVAIADNAVWSTIDMAEYLNLQAVVPLYASEFVDAGTGIALAKAVSHIVTLTDDITAYLITRSTPTLTSTSDITITLRFRQF